MSSDRERPDSDDDIRLETRLEESHRRWRYDDHGRIQSWIPAWRRSPGYWAKSALFLALAAPGCLLAMKLAPETGDGRGYVVFTYMAVAVVTSFVLAEAVWHAIGPRGRELMRVAVFLLPLAAFGALFVWGIFDRMANPLQGPGSKCSRGGILWPPNA